MKRIGVAAVAAFCGMAAGAACTVESMTDDAMKAATETREFVSTNDFKLGYRIHLPSEPAGKPLVLLMHGLGEVGNDNFIQLKNGGPQLLNYISEPGHEAVLIAPQCPTGHRWMECHPWEVPPRWTVTPEPAKPIAAVLELVEKTVKEFGLDGARIYVTGMSMGGFATWELITRRPNLFAAALPVCGGGDPDMAARLLRVPIWVTHNRDDTVVNPQFNRNMMKAFWDLGAKNVRYTEFWEGGHDAWNPTYGRREILDWLFSRRRW